jgi:hypothetical protein
MPQGIDAYGVRVIETRKGVCGLCGLILFFAAALAAQQMPRIDGETLAGHKISLPQASAGKVAVFIL